jgi:uncharacterized protein (UPF0332 family)
MLDDKKIEQIRRKVPEYFSNGDISKEDKNKSLVNFYTENALISLNTAKLLNNISFSKELKKQFDFLEEDFESYLWIINASYYSMFYMAGALLAKEGIKVKSEIGIHMKTFEAMVYYFYLNRKIAKKYLEDFEEAQEESQELLGKEEPINIMQRKAKELMVKYDYEMDKRSKFTYNMGEKAKSAIALTSLRRAIEFYNECLKMIGA